jgi:FkbM family methyltransferase
VASAARALEVPWLRFRRLTEYDCGIVRSVTEVLKATLRYGLRSFGFELRRVEPVGATGATLPRGSSFAARAAQLLGPRTVTVLDVGARWADTSPAWYALPPLARVIGFEPDPAECARLNAQAGPGEEFVAVALGAKAETRPFYLTRDPACSSLYPPSPAVIDRYAHTQVMSLAETRTVRTIPLADWVRQAAPPPVVFLKLDVQGAELDVLVGAGAVLDSVLGLEIEAEFSPLYEGQPLFADIDQFLRARGFVLWRLSHLVHYGEQPTAELVGSGIAYYSNRAVQTVVGSGRLFWAHALYLRDYRTVAANPAGLVLAALLEAAGELDGYAACLAYHHLRPSEG